MLKTLLIEAPKVNGEALTIKPMDYDTGGDNLSFFYKHIGCNCIDIVDAYGLKSIEQLKDICLVVDDEGLCRESSLNPIASLLYGILEHNQPIVGNVLVCKNVYTDSGIETGGLTDGEIIMIDAAIRQLVEKNNKKVEERRNKV